MILVPSTRQRIARIPFLFRAHECLDETGLYALSFGQRVYATFTRADAATTVDQRGRFIRVPSGMPRLTTRGGRIALQLESADQNLALRSAEFDHAAHASVGSPSVTANAATAPDGSLTADTITDSSAAEVRGKRQTFTVANDSVRYVEMVCVRKATAAPTANWPLLNLRFTGGTTVDAYAVLNPFTGATALSAAGAACGAEDCGDYWLFWISAANNSTGNTSMLASYYPAGVDTFTASTGVAGQGSAEFWGLHVAIGTAPPSYIPTTTAAVSRAADLCYFPLRMALAECTTYVRCVHRGIVDSGNDRYLQWGNAAGTGRRLGLRKGLTLVDAFYHDGTTQATGGGIATSMAYGALQEIRATLSAAGVIQAHTSVNGGAEASGAASAAVALVSGMEDQRVYLNSGGASTIGRADFTHAAIIHGTVGRDALRDLCEVG